MKKILITGKNSYVGNSFYEYIINNFGDEYQVDKISLKEQKIEDIDLSGYDSIFHVAGIAHSDYGNISEDRAKEYYNINTDLTIKLARIAKKKKVKQFVFMSSIIVYGESAPIGIKKVITKETLPTPKNAYGDSKLKAEEVIKDLNDESFKVAIIRAPMIYGKNSKGNYKTLEKFALKLPVFPCIENERSVINIDRLCLYVKDIIDDNKSGIFFPQDEEYMNTSLMVKKIANDKGKNILLIRGFGILLKALSGFMPVISKAFGNLVYLKDLKHIEFLPYIKKDLNKHILLISQYFYPETFRVNDMACEWVKRGYKVTVLTGIPNYPMGKYFDGYDCKNKTREVWNGVNIIRIPLIARGNSSNKILNALGMIANYFSFVISGYKWIRSKEAKDLQIDLAFTFEVSPMTQALIGVWYGKKYNVPTFLYVQDLWPENVELVAGIHSQLVIKPINLMVDYIYKNTDRIFTTSESFKKAIIKRKVSVLQEKVNCWYQYAEDFYKPIDKLIATDKLEKFDLAEEGQYLIGYHGLKIAFTGNLGLAQGLDIFPKTACELKKLGIMQEDIKFIIVGNGRYQKTLIDEVKEKDLEDYFVFLGRQAAESIPYLLALVDIAYLTYPDAQTIPAKLQSYMACGKCVLANAEFETQKIIEESKCGICNKFGDEKGFANSIYKIIKSRMNLQEYGNNARDYFLKHFDKKMLMDEMDQYINEILKK